MREIKFNVADINLCTEAEGPGKRLTVWFQGCALRCEGCCNPAFQEFAPRHIMTLEELTGVIGEAKALYGIEGVTYSGGEPTAQQGLPRLTAAIHGMGLGVISFTGRTYEDVKEALAGCDAVLDGAYVASRPEKKRRLLGSENQRVINLTGRYKDLDGWFSAGPCKKVEISAGSRIVANGDMF